MNSIKKNLGNFLIIIIGYAAALFINNNAENSLNIESSVIRTTPDNLFNKVKYIAMDTNGVPLYTVSSPVMRQFFDNEVIEAESPNILLFRKDKPPTKITSNFGKIAYKRHNIKLSGDVNMYFKENLSEPFLKLNTDEIYIYLDEQLAVTDSEVFIKKNNSHLNGKGMKSSLSKGEFIIFENTRGKHVR